MKLSKRLNAIADLVDTKRVIDVGCDHGYLDIYLTLYKNCSCLATDISSNAIKSCQDNIHKYRLDDKIETMVTDGIDNIKINKEDTIVLSGMGTNTIIDILSNKELSDTIIISSNNDLEGLRRLIVSIGYYIDNEVYVIEHDIHYVIIKFIRGNKEYSDYDYILGPMVIKNKDYRDYLLNKYHGILGKIPNEHVKLLTYYKRLIAYLEKSSY